MRRRLLVVFDRFRVTRKVGSALTVALMGKQYDVIAVYVKDCPRPIEIFTLDSLTELEVAEVRDLVRTSNCTETSSSPIEPLSI